MKDDPWSAIFSKYSIQRHDFSETPYIITAQQIKEATNHFKKTSQKEVRILCKQDTRSDRPKIFVEPGLFLLPINNGVYAIVKGEGYADIPPIVHMEDYSPKMSFSLETASVGNSEMQHLDFAFAVSLVRTCMEDDTLVLTIRGRKYTPPFSFFVGKQKIDAKSVQTEVDAGYEGRDQVVLIEAKNTVTDNIIIRQLFDPFRQWLAWTKKAVKTLFFEKRGDYYFLWQFDFKDKNNYNSFQLIKSCRYKIANY